MVDMITCRIGLTIIDERNSSTKGSEKGMYTVDVWVHGRTGYAMRTYWRPLMIRIVSSHRLSICTRETTAHDAYHKRNSLLSQHMPHTVAFTHQGRYPADGPSKRGQPVAFQWIPGHGGISGISHISSISKNVREDPCFAAGEGPRHPCSR